jgi:hypothetical protein
MFVHGIGEFAHALAERRAVRLELKEVKRFDSGVVLLSCLPTS